MKCVAEGVFDYYEIDFEHWVLDEDYIYTLVKLNNLEDFK